MEKNHYCDRAYLFISYLLMYPGTAKGISLATDSENEENEENEENDIHCVTMINPFTMGWR